MRFRWRKLCFASVFVLTAVFLRGDTLYAQEPAPNLEGPILSWTNHFRTLDGHSALVPSSHLTMLARQHAQKMAELERADVPGIKPASERAKAEGLLFTGVVETVVACADQPGAAWKIFELLRQTRADGQNPRTKDFTDIGLGVYRSQSGKYYVSQVMGIRSGQPVPVVTVPSAQVYPSAPAKVPLLPQPALPQPPVRQPPPGQPSFYSALPPPGRPGLQLGFGLPPSGEYYTHPFTPYFE